MNYCNYILVLVNDEAIDALEENIEKHLSINVVLSGRSEGKPR
jgi:hypothetical protein